MALKEVYQYSEHSPYRIIYTRPGSEVEVTTGQMDRPVPVRPETRRYLTCPSSTSVSVVEVDQHNPATKTKSTTTVREISSRDTVPTSTALIKKTITTVTDTLATKVHRTSSKTGTLYFAYGSDLSPSHLKSKGNLSFDSSSRPVALAKLTGWQWMISSRGVPNLIPLCDRAVYSKGGSLRTREKNTDAGVVYGLLYNLHPDDESRIDGKRGYREHGPINMGVEVDTEEAACRPYTQGDNTVNKIYERVDILEWFSDPLKEGVNIIRDAVNVRCMIYIDESSRGTRPGRIWDDVIDKVSNGVSVAVNRYGMSRRWVEYVMGQHGIYVRRDKHPRSRSKEIVDVVRFEDTKSYRSVSDDESDSDGGESIIETRITKRITEGYEVPRSDFYREKRGKSTRYISL